jgi:hypothetical protein
VKVDVGGQVFHTTRATLTKDPGSMLHAMFSGCFPLDMDTDGRSFIDRDPRHFPLILNYLRDGTFDLPEHPDDRSAFLREARFYGLDSLTGRVAAAADGAGGPLAVRRGGRYDGPGPQRQRHRRGTRQPQWIRGPDGRRAALHLVPGLSPDVAFPHVANVFPLGDDPYCIPAWVQTTGNHNSLHLGWGGDLINQPTVMFLDWTGCNHVWFCGNVRLEQSARKVRPGVWHHLAMQYDGEWLEIWTDGVRVARDRPDAAHAVPHPAVLHMGVLSSPAMISDVRVYNRALFADEVSALAGMYNPAAPGDGAGDTA